MQAGAGKDQREIRVELRTVLNRKLCIRKCFRKHLGSGEELTIFEGKCVKLLYLHNSFCVPFSSGELLKQLCCLCKLL